MLYKAGEKIINFFDNYSAIVSEAKHASILEKGLKILTPN